MPDTARVAGMGERPLAVELFAGLHGWGEGLVAEGFRVIGFDIVDMCAALGKPRPAGVHLVLQDVLTLHGSQFKDAAVIVASPPCEEFTRWMMPWTRRRNPPQPSLACFEACWRIAREADRPIVIENVREAQNWVGGARAHYGSRYLWGDVPALMPPPNGERIKESMSSSARAERAKIPFPLAQHIAKVFRP